jgi:predicted molibdopterin-dependent oxidoreductase YjgC
LEGDLDIDDKIIPGEIVTVWIDGEPLQARRGQTIATAIIASGRRILRHTRRVGKPRGLFCAMGVCFDCVMTVHGQQGVRACMTGVEEGMQISSPTQFKPYEPKS